MDSKKYKFFYFVIDAFIITVIAGVLWNNFHEPDLKIDFNDNSNIVITRINETEVRNNIEAEFMIDSYHIGDTLNVEYYSYHQPIKSKEILIPYYSTTLKIIILLTVFIYIIIGIYVIKIKSAEYVSRVFHDTTFSAALLIGITWCGFNHLSININIISRLLYDSSYLLLGLNLLRFSVAFPIEKKIIKSKFMLSQYLLALIVLIITAYYIISTDNSPIDSFRKYWTVHEFVVIPVFIYFVLLSLLFIFHSYIVHKETTERQKIKWIGIGIFIAIINFSFLWLVPKHIFRKEIISEDLMYILTLPAPVAMFIAIVKYRIFNIDFLISKTTLIAIIAAILSAFYGLLFMLIPIDKDYFKPIFLVVTAITMLLFSNYKARFDALIERLLFSEKFRQRKINEKYSRLISDCYSIREAVELLYDFIRDSNLAESFELTVMNIENNNILYYKDGNDYRISFNYDKLNELLNTDKLNSDNNFIIADRNTIETDVKIIPADNTIFADSKFKLNIISLSADRDLALIACLGNHTKRIKFSREDIDYLSNKTGLVINIIYKLQMMNEIIGKERENRKLIELNEMKSWFVSSVSHELKTPLTSIRIFSELLETSKDQEDKKKYEYLGLIQLECDRLTRLINNLLDFSKMGKGTKTFIFHNIDLKEIINHSLTILESELKMNGFEVSLLLTDDDAIAFADRDALIEVFINIINNSIKYSDLERHIMIRLDNSDQLKIEFEDKGIGISNEDLKHIYEPFYRSSNPYASQQGGTGIGLPIVSNIIKAHSGKITAISKLGKGTKFIIYLPKVNQHEEDFVNRR